MKIKKTFLVLTLLISFLGITFGLNLSWSNIFVEGCVYAEEPDWGTWDETKTWETDPRTFPLSDAGMNVWASTTVEWLLKNIINTFAATVSVFAILGIIIGGILLMTAFGQEEKIQTGKAVMLYSILGLVFTLLAYIIVAFVQTVIYSIH